MRYLLFGVLVVYLLPTQAWCDNSVGKVKDITQTVQKKSNIGVPYLINAVQGVAGAAVGAIRCIPIVETISPPEVPVQ